MPAALTANIPTQCLVKGKRMSLGVSTVKLSLPGITPLRIGCEHPPDGRGASAPASAIDPPLPPPPVDPPAPPPDVLAPPALEVAPPTPPVSVELPPLPPVVAFDPAVPLPALVVAADPDPCAPPPPDWVVPPGPEGDDSPLHAEAAEVSATSQRMRFISGPSASGDRF
jgi:hypothetical protein